MSETRWQIRHKKTGQPFNHPEVANRLYYRKSHALAYMAGDMWAEWHVVKVRVEVVSS